MVDVLSVILVGLHFNLVSMLSFNKDISEVGHTHNYSPDWLGLLKNNVNQHCFIVCCHNTFLH